MLVCWWICAASFLLLLLALSRQRRYVPTKRVLFCPSQFYFVRTFTARQLSIRRCHPVLLNLLFLQVFSTKHVDRRRWNASGSYISVSFRNRKLATFCSDPNNMSVILTKWMWLDGGHFRGWRQPFITLWVAYVRRSERNSGGSSADRSSLL